MRVARYIVANDSQKENNQQIFNANIFKIFYLLRNVAFCDITNTRSFYMLKDNDNGTFIPLLMCLQ